MVKIAWDLLDEAFILVAATALLLMPTYSSACSYQADMCMCETAHQLVSEECEGLLGSNNRLHDRVHQLCSRDLCYRQQSWPRQHLQHSSNLPSAHNAATPDGQIISTCSMAGKQHQATSGFGIPGCTHSQSGV